MNFKTSRRLTRLPAAPTQAVNLSLGRYDEPIRTEQRAEADGGGRVARVRPRSPVTSAQVASQSGTGDHPDPETQAQFRQSVRSLFRFRQVGDDHLGSCRGERCPLLIWERGKSGWRGWLDGAHQV